MSWTDYSCDLEARTQQGRPSGRLRISRVNRRLLRIVWSELHQKPWPEGMFACHHCDEPRCANPHHIFPGTSSDNNKDAFNKRGHWGSIRPGEDHGPSKLTTKEVLEIKQMLSSGERQGNIARRFGVDPSTISNICTGKRWGWLA